MTEGINSKIDINAPIETGKEIIKTVKEDELFLFNVHSDEYNDDPDFSLTDKDDKVEELRLQLKSVEDEQGILGKLCDFTKSVVGLGSSSDKLEELIEEYKHGKMTYEEVQEKIEKHRENQKDDVNFVANTATYVAGFAIGATVLATGGAALPVFALAVGAGTLIGAATKTGLKVFDRATNNIDNDALDGNQIKRDAISGAVGGGATVATGPLGKVGAAAKTFFQRVVLPNFKAGAVDGAITGAADNLAEVAFDENKEFDAVDFAKDTMVGTISFGAAGGIRAGVSAGISKIAANKIVKGAVKGIKSLTNKTFNFLNNIGKTSSVSAENTGAGALGLYLGD